MNTQKRPQTPDQEKQQRRQQQAKDRAEQIREEEDRMPVNPYPLN